jgi:hypothetical protein
MLTTPTESKKLLKGKIATAMFSGCSMMAFQEFDETLLREFNLKYNWLSKTESLVWEIAGLNIKTVKN